MKKFIATGPYEGESFVLNDRYKFVKGEMLVEDDDAEKIKPILCGFYACEMHAVEVAESDEEVDETSLSKEVTQGTAED